MRDKLVEKLAEMWRKAEDYFIETESDSKKWKVLEYQESLNLTKEEEEELNLTLDSMGV